MSGLRSGVTFAVVLCVAIIGGGVFSAMKTPDSDGWGADTYGTHWDGYRGMYEMLQELGTPVERRTAPPSPDMAPSTTLVLWRPDSDLVSVEPAHLTALGAWVERGGRIVVAPRVHGTNDDLRAAMRRKPTQVGVL